MFPASPDLYSTAGSAKHRGLGAGVYHSACGDVREGGLRGVSKSVSETGVHCLVSGASGYLGRALVAALLAEDHVVTALEHRVDSIATELRGRLHGCLRADLATAAPDLRSARPAVVYHLAAVAHRSADDQAYRQLNVEGTLALARAAIAAGVERFVFVSSVKALPYLTDRNTAGGAATGGHGDADLQKDFPGEVLPDRKPLSYGHSKALAEVRLSELCRAAGMQLVVVRPALVYSHDAPGNLARLRRWCALRLPQPPRGGVRSMIALSDLLRLLLLFASPGETSATRIVTATDGQAYSTRRIHAAWCRYLGVTPILPSPPATLWRWATSSFDALRGAAPGSSWAQLAADECYAPSGLAQLGFETRETLESCLGLQCVGSRQ